MNQRWFLGPLPARLDRGNLTLVRAAAAELPSVNPEDALRICLLLRDADPSRYERAVIRWLGRLCLERPRLTLEELRRALAAAASPRS